MKSIYERLEEETLKIKLEKKKEIGTVLTEEEILLVLNELKNKDLELKPMFLVLEKLIKHIPQEKQMIIEEIIIDLFKYYNLLENTDILNIRHKLFFTDDKKIVKKPYFSPETRQLLTEKLQTIFEKI